MKSLKTKQFNLHMHQLVHTGEKQQMCGRLPAAPPGGGRKVAGWWGAAGRCQPGHTGLAGPALGAQVGRQAGGHTRHTCAASHQCAQAGMYVG